MAEPGVTVIAYIGGLSQMERTYIFRREDTGELIEQPFSAVLQQDMAGYITLPDGAQAKRCVHLEECQKRKVKQAPLPARPVVSDALGFGQHQLAEFEEDRQRNGFGGVEFVRDPAVPEFFQVKCSSRREFNRYARHRGYENKSTFGGVIFSQEDLDRARRLGS